MHYRFLLILLVLCLYSISGQEPPSNSGSTSIESQLSGKEKICKLIRLGNECLEADSNQSLEFGKTALNEASKFNFRKEQAEARLLMGLSYWSIRELKPTLVNLNSAKQVYEQLLDHDGIARCYINMGLVYAEIGEYDKAIELYSNAKSHFEELNLKELIANTYTKISSVLIEKKDLNEAENILHDALNIYDQSKNIRGIVETNNLLAKLHINKGEYELAGCYIEESIINSQIIKDNNALIGNLLLFSKLQRNKKKYEVAEQHLTIALKLAEKKNLRKLKLDTYEELQSIKKEEGKFQESIEYFEEYVALKDSIYDTNKSKQLAEFEFQDTIKKKDDELEFMYLEKKDFQIIQWILGIGLFIITLLGLLLTRSLRIKNKKQLLLHESNQRINQSEIENQLLKQKELEQQLHFKNKELTSYALNFIQKNEFLEKLQNIIKEIKLTSAKTKVLALDQLENIVKQQQNLDKNWNDFKIHFEQVHTDFLKKLKHEFPNLSANDLKVAALTRLNLTIKECSGILGISPESVKTARYRLRKKLDLEREDDLLSFLVKVEV
ncbi:tetratricopeptide repeat protein [Spongiivirga citrea]|uniref:Tetratricopeptide repeat protein n=1 Tax=Spongiivirga citrea TaxID=1481457 RepID=A0A6M0CFP7_9FLAO|nr:transcriptional regulator [Spongiivirga citrea]NER16262.1 tetratricopeptide repeat protein [Spongiivirga citrea]